MHVESNGQKFDTGLLLASLELGDWSHFTNKHSENLYIYFTQLRHQQENTDMNMPY